MEYAHYWNPGRTFYPSWDSSVRCASNPNLMFTPGLKPVAQVSGYPDSIVKWITRWCMNQVVLESRPGMSMNFRMQINPADKS